MSAIEETAETTTGRALGARLSAVLSSSALSWAVVAAGAVLRIAQYVFNRSLWVDESYVALNIVNRSFRGLTEPLFHNQAAPFGFLWLEKLSVLVFGTGELALRLVPLLAALAALVLFREVARRVLRPELAVLALALFAVSDRLIYYASEVKQYSSDVAVTLALLLVAIDAAAADRLSWRWVTTLSAAGVAGVWLSHPAAFVLAGAGLTLGVAALARRDWSRVRRLAIVGAIWAANFAAAFAISLGEIASDAKHQRYWGDTFMPMPPFGGEGIMWLKTAMLSAFENPAGLTPAWLGLSCFAVGCVYLLVAKREHAAILLLPLVLCLVASGLRKYPFGNRLVLFLVPVFVLVVAKGVEAVVTKIRYAGPVLGLALAAALLVQPSLTAARGLKHPRTHEEIKPVLAHVRDRRQPGDLIYIYYGAQYPMQYYAPRYGFADGEYVLGKIARRHPERYLAQLDALRGNARVWIVFSHPTVKRGLDEQQYFLDYLDGIGTRLDEIREQDASGYLYDLSRSQ